MAIQWDNGEVSHEGRVLAYPVYHAQACSSDYEPVYATVILEGGVVDDLRVGTVSYASRWGGGATVDATDEAKSEMDAHDRHRNAVFAEEKAAEASVNRFYRLEKDAVVRFVKGRKVKKGTVAPVAWFGCRYDEQRVGVRVGAEVVFVAADNCVRDHSGAEAESLARAWDRWVESQAATEDLVEHEHNVRGAFDPKQAEGRWHRYQRAVARWAKDWPPIDSDHRADVVGRIEALRAVRHVPNAAERTAGELVTV